MTARHSPKELLVVWSILVAGAIACNVPGLIGPQVGPAPTQPPVQLPTEPVGLPTQPVATLQQPTLPPPPTTAPTLPPTAVPSPTTDVITMGAPEVSANTLYKGAGGCEPKEITFRIKVTNPAQVKNVILFLRTQDKSTASKTDWDEGTALNPGNEGSYSKTFHSSGIPTYGSFGNAWLYYQFVVTDKQNKLIRGRVFTDVSFLACP
ncbi:MAG: hypothetical protein NTY23_14460 [Chloroflexi bacterium]|nr:hypothetical protein [Chloroflexota bacterium]